MAITRPTGEQLVFNSSTTGVHVLDEYLEGCERAGKTLSEIVDGLVDLDGNPQGYSFRYDGTSGYVQYRVGTGAWTNLFDLASSTADAQAARDAAQAAQLASETARDASQGYANDAANSANQSGASATAAQGHANTAKGYSDRFLPPSATAPTTRVDGSALQNGDVYLNTALDAVFVRDGSTWVEMTLTPSEYVSFLDIHPDPIMLSSIDPATGQASWTVSGYPTGFGDAHVSVTGDLEMSVDGGSTWATTGTATNGVTIIVRPMGSLVNATTYTGRLSVGGESATYSFTYVAAYIEGPAIVSPSDGATNIGETPTLTGSAYNILPGDAMDGDHPHASSSWYVYSLPDWTLVWASQNDTVNKVTITVPGGILQPSTSYAASVTYTSSTGMQASSDTVTFTTAASFGLTLLYTDSGYAVVPGDVDEVFSSSLYIGTGSALSVTTNLPFDSATEEALVWIKQRSGTEEHALFDTVRGLNKRLRTNSTSAEDIPGNGVEVSSIGNGVFSLPVATYATVNGSGSEYGSFVFKKQAGFFEIATASHTNGTATTVDLSSLGTVGMVWVKRSDGVSDWLVWHKDAAAGSLLVLNSIAAATTNASVSVSGTTLTIAASVATGTYVIYAWAHNTGADWRVKCGSYTGTGVVGLDVECGGPVGLVLYKADASSNWQLADLTGGGLVYGSGAYVNPNTSGAAPYFVEMEPTPTGLKVMWAGANNTDGRVVYFMVIRRGPMYATDVPAQVYQGITVDPADTGTTQVNGIGFRGDFIINHDVSVTGNRLVASSLLSRKIGGVTQNFSLNSTNTATEATNPVVQLTQQGLVVNATNGWDTDNQRLDVFKHMPGVFTSLIYRGTGSAMAVSHGLGVTPELYAVKCVSASALHWIVEHSDYPIVQYLMLDDSSALSSAAHFSSVADATNIYPATGSHSANGADRAFLALLFASKPGVSKVFSFTTDASGNATVMGFGFRPRFVLLKRTDTTSAWDVWTAEMGISASTAPSAEPFFYLNTTDAEVTANDFIDTTADGFNVKGLWPNGTVVGVAIA